MPSIDSIHPIAGDRYINKAIDLRAVGPGHDKARVFVLGLDTNDDGKGAWYKWNNTNADSDDGRLTLKVSDVTTGRWQREVSDVAAQDDIGAVLRELIGNDFAKHHKDAADGAASTATAEHAFYYAEKARTIAAIKLVPADALTASDTNYATIAVYKRSADGQTQTAIASLATTTAGSGNWTAHVAEAFATLSETKLAAGEQLTFEITKAASGVAVPALELIVEFSEPKLRRQANLSKDSADALASTATGEKAFGWSSVRRVIESVKFIPDAALTANDTNYATITVKKRDNAGANPATVVALTTQTSGSGDLTAFEPVDFGALTTTELLPGEQLTVTIAKASSGVIVPAGLLVVTYSEAKIADNAEFHKDAADAAAATTTAVKTFYRNQTGVRRKITAIKFVPNAALTADDTDFATLTVSRRDAAGGNAATVAAILTTITGGTGDWTAHVPIDFGDLSVNTLDDDEHLTITIAKASSGVAVPAGQLVVELDQVETNLVSAVQARVQKLTVTVGHADLTEVTNGVAQAINIGSPLPANAEIVGWYLGDVTGFAGGTVSECKVDIGGTDTDALCAALELISDAPTGAEIVAAMGVKFQGGSFQNQQLVATFTPDAGNPLVDLSSGSVKITIYYTVV